MLWSMTGIRSCPSRRAGGGHLKVSFWLGAMGVGAPPSDLLQVWAWFSVDTWKGPALAPWKHSQSTGLCLPVPHVGRGLKTLGARGEIRVDFLEVGAKPWST